MLEQGSTSGHVITELPHNESFILITGAMSEESLHTCRKTPWEKVENRDLQVHH